MADKRRVLLEDVITRNSVERLRKGFEDGMDLLVAGSQPGTTAYTIHKSHLDEAGEPILRYLFAVMRASAVYDPKSPFPGFPYRNRVAITHIFRQYMKGEGGKGNEHPNEYTALIGSANRLLARNGIIRIYKRGVIYLTDSWPAEQKLGWTDPSGPYITKVDEREEVRIAAEKDKPVQVYRNLRTVKLPASFDADSVKSWIKTFVPAALALQDEYDKLRAKVAELEDKVEAAAKAVEEVAEKKEWEEVGSELGSIFGDTSHP